jgi:predicted RNA-binding Zn-ribbon protein involved in translation (DUF1610 family)
MISFIKDCVLVVMSLNKDKHICPLCGSKQIYLMDTYVCKMCNNLAYYDLKWCLEWMKKIGH